jgi:hypothetical protein
MEIFSSVYKTTLPWDLNPIIVDPCVLELRDMQQEMLSELRSMQQQKLIVWLHKQMI